MRKKETLEIINVLVEMKQIERMKDKSSTISWEADQKQKNEEKQ